MQIHYAKPEKDPAPDPDPIPEEEEPTVEPQGGGVGGEPTWP